MSNDIRIRKGLDIKLVGGAATKITDLALASEYAIKPEDFHLVVPKLIAKEGIEVQAGETIFFDKKNESILFASPVSGKITEIVRGERRRILAIKIHPSAEQHFKNHGKKNAEQMNEAQVKEFLLSAGAWPFIKQRPYDVIANPNVAPKAIFISACKTAPLAPNYSFALAGKEEALQQAVTALSKLTKGKVHVGVAKDDSTSPFRKLQNITLHNVSGPHPAGNVSTQIALIDPINKGEVVWVVTPQDLLVIGNLFLTGELRIERVAALAGADVKNPQYIRVIAGAKMADVVKGQVENLSATRVISGDVLTGKTANDGYLGFYDDQITAIPEGNDYEFFGWALPTASKISQTRSLTFSWLGGNNKEYNLNTNTNGEHRAFVVTGLYEEVFPLDIYPMHLLKACKYQDLDELENLGAYEVAPEDFALTEFVCPSKQPHQKIIREGLDLMMQELG